MINYQSVKRLDKYYLIWIIMVLDLAYFTKRKIVITL
jgi:hypothetical protein